MTSKSKEVTRLIIMYFSKNQLTLIKPDEKPVVLTTNELIKKYFGVYGHTVFNVGCGRNELEGKSSP